MKNNKFVNLCVVILISVTVLSSLLTRPNHPISSSNSLYHAVDFSGIENPPLWENSVPDVQDHSLFNLSYTQLQNFFAYKEKQYKERANQIFRFCPLMSDAANHPSQKSMLCRQDTDQRCLMVVDPKDKVAFCRNAKVSSTAWLARFHILWQNGSNVEESLAPPVLSKQDTENFHESAHRWWNLSKRKKMAYLTRPGALLSFVMVRHPLDRLASAYYDKIIGEASKTNFKKIVDKIKEKFAISRPEISPEEFVKFVINEGQTLNLHQINEHWRPQTANCPFCHFKYGVYGKYETSKEDTAYILLKSNLTMLKKVGKVNGDHKSHLSPPKRRKAFWTAVPVHYLSDLKKMFYWDFLLFDYN